jgi:hypothetical protein
MTAPTPPDPTTLGIIELGQLCARQRAICLDLFEQLGALVTADATPAGADQQIYATACHRHAWHAELWAARTPTIPAVGSEAMGSEAVGTETSVASFRGELGAAVDAESYQKIIERLRRELTELRTRFDPLLDPSTDRVISLVLADL